MNFEEHLKIGIVTGLIIALLGIRYEANVFQWLPIVFNSVFGSIIGAMLPDILEPPTNYRHRNFFHSIIVLVVLLVAFLLFLLKIQKYFLPFLANLRFRMKYSLL